MWRDDIAHFRGTLVAAKPNFFIVGAPKCGTTALYEYLGGHPNIFMPAYKEPHYFAQDLGLYPLIKSAAAYAALFQPATDRHVRVGEASVYYLRSTVALPRIREFDATARIIAMFRDPVEIVHALHAQLLYVGEETVRDFETAWRLQGRRSRGADLPPRSRDPFLFQFTQLGQLGTQTQRLLEQFPRNQVKLILYEDFAAAPRRVYDEVIEFLELPPDGRSEFSRVNPNKRARIDWLKRFLRKPPPALQGAVRRLKRLLGGKSLGLLKSGLVRLNTVAERRKPLPPSLRAEMIDTFRDEIRLLSHLVDRDLSHWGLERS
jgi:hypothetical protein